MSVQVVSRSTPIESRVPAAESDTPALEVLLALTERLASDTTLEAALDAVAVAATELLPGDHASVRLLDEGGQELLSGARAGAGLEAEPPKFRKGQGVVGWVAENGLVAHVPDTGRDERFEQRPGQGFTVASLVAVPMWSGGKTVGVLSVSAPVPLAFSDRDVLLARLLANCASPAIEKARLERLALTDAGTRAFNRHYLMPRLERAIAAARRQPTCFTLLVMDLDHFKRVNDVFGHAVGDRVLGEFADRVREATRKVDELVRWGGEEFVLIMPGADLVSASAVAERVRAHIAATPFECDGHQIDQTVSIGVATWDGAETPHDLQRRADEAMYRAKRAGRNRVHV